jgi:hypothetical protein
VKVKHFKNQQMVIEDKVMTWEDIKKVYPDEWVVVANPVFDGMKIVEGIVISNHHDKRIASMEGGEKRAPYPSVTLTFTGQMPPQKRIGILIRREKSLK